MKDWWHSPIRCKWLAHWLLLPLWRLYDWVTPKRRSHWAFFVHPLKASQFVENSRALFESVKADPSIHKWVFTRDLNVDLRIEGACNTEVIDVQSLRGLRELARCGVYLLTNAVALDMSWRWPNGSRQHIHIYNWIKNLVISGSFFCRIINIMLNSPPSTTKKSPRTVGNYYYLD